MAMRFVMNPIGVMGGLRTSVGSFSYFLVTDVAILLYIKLHSSIQGCV